jgi:hypothetical protein
LETGKDLDRDPGRRCGPVDEDPRLFEAATDVEVEVSRFKSTLRRLWLLLLCPSIVSQVCRMMTSR